MSRCGHEILRKYWRQYCLLLFWSWYSRYPSFSRHSPTARHYVQSRIRRLLLQVCYQWVNNFGFSQGQLKGTSGLNAGLNRNDIFISRYCEAMATASSGRAYLVVLNYNGDSVANQGGKPTPKHWTKSMEALGIWHLKIERMYHLYSINPSFTLKVRR